MAATELAYRVATGAAIEIVEYRRRQFAPGNLAEIHEVVAVADSHGARIARDSTKSARRLL
jgi:hypothetical protein